MYAAAPFAPSARLPNASCASSTGRVNETPAVCADGAVATKWSAAACSTLNEAEASSVPARSAAFAVMVVACARNRVVVSTVVDTPLANVTAVVKLSVPVSGPFDAPDSV